MRGACSMTPVVTLSPAAGSVQGNADAVDVLHNEIKATLGGKLEVQATVKYFDTIVPAANDGPKWFYCPDLIVTNSGTNWMDMYAKSAGVWNNNDSTMTTTKCDRFTDYDFLAGSVADADNLLMIYVENTGIDNTGAATTNVIGYSDSSDSSPWSSSSAGTKVLEPGESIILKYAYNQLLDGGGVSTCESQCNDHFFQGMGASGTTMSGPDHVCMKLVAFIEDAI